MANYWTGTNKEKFVEYLLTINSIKGYKGRVKCFECQFGTDYFSAF